MKINEIISNQFLKLRVWITLPRTMEMPQYPPFITQSPKPNAHTEQDTAQKVRSDDPWLDDPSYMNHPGNHFYHIFHD